MTSPCLELAALHLIGFSTQCTGVSWIWRPFYLHDRVLGYRCFCLCYLSLLSSSHTGLCPVTLFACYDTVMMNRDTGRS
ncbi:hypothetical protein V8F44DRAFT_611431 [Aspergillus fumigatus]